MKLIMPLRYNVAFLSALFACASIMFNAWAGPDHGALTKAAFLVTITLAPAYLSMCVIMAGKTLVHRGQTAVNPTVWLMALMSMSIAGSGLVFLGLDQFLDAVVEGIFAGLAGSAATVLTAFIKQAEAGEDE